MEAGVVAWRFYQRSRNNNRRRAVPADDCAEPCRAGGYHGVFKHVSGIGQHQARAAELRGAPDHLRSAADMVIRQARISHRVRLVSIDCDDHAAGVVEFVVAAPGVQETAGAAGAMKRRPRSSCKTSAPAYCKMPLMHL